ncbi:MAG: hypothetical protein JWO31_1280, partial [Phycisphaerales bacterium]|nr:hypothetical protein [Phycisphaerales bacterium]
MITLICTKCKTTLEMDDAFAGGVCRCQHCGTIQTVPSHLKQSARGSGANAQKALYSSRSATGAGVPSSGLDDLASVVASSGISSGLVNRRPTPGGLDYADPGTAAKRPGTKLVIVGLSAIVALGLLGFVGFRLLAPAPVTAPAVGIAPPP